MGSIEAEIRTTTAPTTPHIKAPLAKIIFCGSPRAIANKIPANKKQHTTIATATVQKAEITFVPNCVKVVGKAPKAVAGKTIILKIKTLMINFFSIFKLLIL